MDMQSVSTVVSLVNSVVSTAKSAIDIARESSDSDLKGKLSLVLDGVLDLKSLLLEQEDELRKLRQQVNLKLSVHRDGTFGYYYAAGDPDPLCPKCYEGAGKVSHLSKLMPWNGGTRRSCYQCDYVMYEAPAERPRVRMLNRGLPPY